MGEPQNPKTAKDYWELFIMTVLEFLVLGLWLVFLLPLKILDCVLIGAKRVYETIKGTDQC